MESKPSMSENQITERKNSKEKETPKDNNDFPYTEEELLFFTEEIRDLFFIQIKSLYGHFILGKNKFKLQNDLIEKQSIQILFPKKIQSQLNMIKDFSTKMQLLSPSEIFIKLKNSIEFKEHNNESDNCPICMDTFYDIELNLETENEKKFDEILLIDKQLKFEYNVIMLDQCQDHYFHLECLINMKGEKDFIKCPICFNIYGVQTGEQPPGTMMAYIDKNSKCASYEQFDTIVIYYNIPSGKIYSGTRRVAYLPSNDKGWEILGLLKVCFDRKLIFKVGTSVTTGMSNTVVWSGIHHKTNLSGGNFFLIFKVFFL